MNNQRTLEYLCDFVKQRAAIILDAKKSYLIETRLMPLLNRHNLETLEEMVDKLKDRSIMGLDTEVIEAMTTNETFFFRDKVPFETLKDIVLPKMIEERAKKRSLRIWCGASSTGQEPYSIAMVMAEHFPQLMSWDIKFVATDINETVLDQARSGRFKNHEVNRGLDPAFRDRYFRQEDAGHWVVNRDLRNMIEFKYLNLIDPWRWDQPFDIVFMRNVLIYFDVETKQRIFQRIRQYMEPDGVLFLGGAESTVNLDNKFECHRQGRSVYYALAA